MRYGNDHEFIDYVRKNVLGKCSEMASPLPIVAQSALFLSKPPLGVQIHASLKENEKDISLMVTELLSTVGAVENPYD